ncbi:MAG: MATE family efflux transporter [Tolypothrix carrinoi HA7290-LM1]|jgi:MATE family multidrug resistance protein|nr:MATE family efflux transporter [Tolypothrix carrinoi HA7290-LM1]
MPITLKSKLLSEVKACLELAIPLAAAQAMEAAVSLVNTVMMGILGSQALATGALGGITFLSILIICGGIIDPVGAMVAQAFARGKTDEVSHLTFQGLWLTAGMSIPIMLLIWYFSSILQLFGQEESLILSVQTYLRVIVWGFPAALGFHLLRGVASALNRPQILMVILATEVVLQGLVNYVLMFGKFGLPALGIVGIGCASSLVAWVSFITAVVFLKFHKNFRDEKIFDTFHQFDKALCLKIFQVGWPVGLQWGATIGMFAVTSLLMGYLGTEMLAAHEIAFQTEEFLIMIPMGIALATTARVGNAIGQKDNKGAKRAALVSIALGASLMSIVALLIWFFPGYIVAMYLDPHIHNNEEVVKAAILLLKVAALFQISNGIQIITTGALLGLQDTYTSMLITLSAYWFVGLGSGYFMGFTLGWGGMGLWLGLAAGLTVAAVVLMWHFYRLISQAISISEAEEAQNPDQTQQVLIS